MLWPMGGDTVTPRSPGIERTNPTMNPAPTPLPAPDAPKN